MKQTIFTVGVLNSGGCVDTLSLIRAGWSPVWGTEICQTHQHSPAACNTIIRTSSCTDNLQQRMWTDLTGTPCLGNTFSNIAKYLQHEKPTMIASCQPCTDYCIGSTQTGVQGETGWMFVEQTNIILLTLPLTFRLEMSSNAVLVNEGKEFKDVKTRLTQHYHIYSHVYNTWTMGDPIHRLRLFIVGFLREMGESAENFKFPETQFGGQEGKLHTARDMAIPDSQVPLRFWRKDNTTRLEPSQPEPGQVHRLSRAAPGMGPSTNPNLVTSWEGAAPSPTTTNGGTRRPAISWVDHGTNPVGPTRLTTPTETQRNMSLPWDYKKWVNTFNNRDKFLWHCCGNGAPLRTNG